MIRSEPVVSPSGVREARVLLATLPALFLQILFMSLLTMAVPSIQEGLDASPGQVQLVVALYPLGTACLLVIGGSIGDLYGRKTVFTIGVTSFCLASIVCGVAPNALVLMAGAAVQGMSAGLLLPQILSIIQTTFSGLRRSRALGVYSATVALALLVGPVVGGLLLSGNLFGVGWRAIYLIAVPICVAILVISSVALPRSRSDAHIDMDVSGAVMMTIVVLCGILPLSIGPTLGWPSWIKALLWSTPLALVVFVWIERRRARVGRQTIVSTRLLRNGVFRMGLIARFVFSLATPALPFVLPILLQTGAQFTPLQTGLVVSMSSLAEIPVALVAVRIGRSLGGWVLVIGALMAAGSYLVMLQADASGSFTSFLAWMVGGLLLWGAGLGILFPSLLTVTLSRVEPADSGTASGTISLGQQVGGSIAIVLTGALFYGVVAGNALPTVNQVATDARAAVAAAPVPAADWMIEVDRVGECGASFLEGRLKSWEECPADIGSPTTPLSADAPGARADLGAHMVRARATIYTAATRTALVYQMIACLIGAGCVVLLRRRADHGTWRT